MLSIGATGHHIESMFGEMTLKAIWEHEVLLEPLPSVTL
jgi:hypothetical protein